MLNLTVSPCAYITCNDVCVTKKRSNGRFTHLPSCNQHREVIKQAHLLYKKIAALRSELCKKTPDEIDQIIHLLGMELRGREIQMNQIKDMYQDEEHYAYYKILLREYNNMLRHRSFTAIEN